MAKFVKIGKAVLHAVIIIGIVVLLIIGITYGVEFLKGYARSKGQELRARPLMVALTILQKPAQIKLIEYNSIGLKESDGTRSGYFDIAITGIEELEGKIFYDILIKDFDTDEKAEFSTIELLDDEEGKYFKIVFSLKTLDVLAVNTFSKTPMSNEFFKRYTKLKTTKEE